MPALTSRPFGRRPAAAPAQDREERLAQRAARALASARATAGLRCSTSVSTGTTTGRAIPKDRPLRSEAFRRVVASLPCAWCGIAGFSQHAHENEGKGARLKVDDRRAMPLCCVRPDIEGCHQRFDQYRLVPGGRQAHIDLGRALSRRTRAQVLDAGLWPANVPLWKEAP